MQFCPWHSHPKVSAHSLELQSKFLQGTHSLSIHPQPSPHSSPLLQGLLLQVFGSPSIQAQVLGFISVHLLLAPVHIGLSQSHKGTHSSSWQIVPSGHFLSTHPSSEQIKQSPQSLSVSHSGDGTQPSPGL